MTISARSALYRQLQVFFENRLISLYRWGDVQHIPGDKAKQIDGERKPRKNELEEVVRVRFGAFEIEMRSPVDAPPLGRVVLRADGDDLVSGPIDVATFDKIANRLQPEKETA